MFSLFVVCCLVSGVCCVLCFVVACVLRVACWVLLFFAVCALLVVVCYERGVFFVLCRGWQVPCLLCIVCVWWFV